MQKKVLTLIALCDIFFLEIKTRESIRTMERKKFRELAKIRMIKKDMNQAQLAHKIGYKGPSISTFFAGKNDSLEIALRICRELGISDASAYQTCGKAHLLPRGEAKP